MDAKYLLCNECGFTTNLTQLFPKEPLLLMSRADNFYSTTGGIYLILNIGEGHKAHVCMFMCKTHQHLFQSNLNTCLLK